MSTERLPRSAPQAGTTTRAAVRGDGELPPVGPYHCVRRLGAGASGAVFVAIDSRDQRRVALKVLRHREGADEENRQRFLRECAHARTVHHPNVVEFFDSGWDGDQCYLATELLNGGDAAALCRRYPRGMPAIMIAAIGRDCARGLGAIHAAKLIHRDIKPSNIFLGSTGLAKLGDMGLSRHLQHSTDLTVHGHLVGTPEFMAPEQALAEEELDPRADIYGLGASLYYFATGRSPFEGGSAWAILAQLINDPFPDPRTLNASIPDALAQVILKASAKDRAQRYENAGALTDALEQVLSGNGERPSGRRLTIDPDRAPRHVLIVDDDPIIRRVYRSRFELDRLSVDAADSGEQALRLAQSRRPDLILLDLMLPDGDGLAVLKQLRAIHGLATVPVVVFSNAFEEEQHELAKVAGAARVLSKTGCSPRFVSHLVLELLAQASGKTDAGPAGSVAGRAAAEGAPDGAPAAAPAAEQIEAETTRVDIPLTQLRPLAESGLLRLLLHLRDLEADDRMDQRQRILREFAGTAHGLASAAGLVQHAGAALLAAAAEQLAHQLLEWPDRITASARRTLTQAVLALRSVIPTLGQPSSMPTGKALVVDDDPTSLRLACQALEKVGITGIPHTDPQAALRGLEQEEICLVLTDVMMASMNGVQFATKVRNLPAYRQVPVIFVTAVADFRERLGAIGGLRLDAIAKPYLLIELATKALAARLG